MNILIREVNDQKESISNFFHFLERLEFNELIINDINLGEDSRYALPIGISTVQKSSCIILLYNFIESVITNLISKIHDEIIRNNISFFDLNSDIRNKLTKTTKHAKRHFWLNDVCTCHGLLPSHSA